MNVALGAENGNSNNRHTFASGDAPTETGERHRRDPSIVEEVRSLSLGASIFLLVVGAVLYFAVDVTTSGFSINTVGIILMVAGALGLVLSLLFWSSFSPYRRGGTAVGGDTVVEERHIRRDLP
jgi:small-conductance mechanosensitive channel